MSALASQALTGCLVRHRPKEAVFAHGGQLTVVDLNTMAPVSNEDMMSKCVVLP